MIRKLSYLAISATLISLLTTRASASTVVSGLTAAQIVDKNVQARGGLRVWRSIQSMTFTGKMGAGGNQRTTLAPAAESPSHGVAQSLIPARPVEEVQLPFNMDLKRGRKVRFELQFAGQTALQVFDGTNGWKLRPYLNRRIVEPYTPEEMQKASLQSDLDGRLIDYAAKGTKVELQGMEKVENHDSYKLKLTLSNGQIIHHWIDANTFLESKIEGTPRRMDGVDHPVEIYLRDYREVSGVQIPFVLETRVLPVAHTSSPMAATQVPPERLVIEKATVNANLDDALFRKPELPAVTPK